MENHGPNSSLIEPNRVVSRESLVKTSSNLKSLLDRIDKSIDFLVGIIYYLDILSDYLLLFFYYFNDKMAYFYLTSIFIVFPVLSNLLFKIMAFNFKNKDVFSVFHDVTLSLLQLDVFV